jgi:putative ABC transport system ATP-binding protein
MNLSPPIAPSPPALDLAPRQTPPRDPLFCARELTKVYTSGEVDVRALDGVSLDLYAGELIVLLGASGSGKSTLLNILGGLDVPTSGTLSYAGEDLTHAMDEQLTRFRRDSVGFIFQFYNLIPSLTAKENIALITDISRDPMEPEDALALVALSDRGDHFPSQMSGGQQQRVAIARAIAKRPEVLLCDEPTGALDVKTGITVLEAIERVNREIGTLTVVITHNAAIADMADRVIHLSDGKVTEIHRNAERRPVNSIVW